MTDKPMPLTAEEVCETARTAARLGGENADMVVAVCEELLAERSARAAAERDLEKEKASHGATKAEAHQLNTEYNRLARENADLRDVVERLRAETDEARAMHATVCAELQTWIGKEGFGKLRAERDDLLEITNRLPKTADGKVVYLGMTVWAATLDDYENDPDPGAVVHSITRDQAGDVVLTLRDFRGEKGPNFIDEVAPDNCYSTRAAAEAARRAPDAGERGGG